MNSEIANPLRGEACLRVNGEMLVVRPSFAALVAAEEELGPLFTLVERAADGRLGLGEMIGLFWHCLVARPAGGCGQASARPRRRRRRTPVSPQRRRRQRRRHGRGQIASPVGMQRVLRGRGPFLAIHRH